jgi:hypothetical protein
MKHLGVEKTKKQRRLLKGAPMMIVAVLFVLVVVPMVIVMSGQLATVLESAGVRLSPNIDDGHVISEFSDAAGDLLREIPSGQSYEEAGRALDIRKFSVKKVAFRRFSGIGIEPRLNLVFHFDHVLPNPLQSDQKFSLPVIHVYIKAPDAAAEAGDSNKVAQVDLEGGWDYQVIVDGFHDAPRIFDPRGELVGRGLDLFVSNHHRELVFEADKVTAALEKGQQRPAAGPAEDEIEEVTRITAALPMELLGDPERGEWSYYVVVGLADLGSPSMLYPSGAEGEPEIFDCVLPEPAATVRIAADGRAVIEPLVVANPT